MSSLSTTAAGIARGRPVRRLKAHIFDVIKRAGPDGVMFEDINAICFDADRPPSMLGLTSIRSMLRWPGPTNKSTATDPREYYRIVRWRVRAVA